VNQEHYNKLREGVEAWNKWRKEHPDIIPDLERANLGLSHLEGIDLVGAHLERANLGGAHLEGADLGGAHLERANLLHAHLEGASARSAHLERANLLHAHLEGASARSARLQGADFMGAHLEGADLGGAHLERASFLGADLQNVFVLGVQYKKLGRCRGINLEGCSGSPRFIRDAKDNEFIEEVRINHPIKHFIWSISSDCGRSMLLWVGWSLFIAVLCGAAYADYSAPTWLPEWLVNMAPDVDLQGRSPTWFTPYYFSIVTFTTLGFGDVVPRNLAAEIWLTIEVIIGYVMLGGLIAIFATKLARRSE
jgi:uncharacterized protein YjbI with pentapeptide repeats